MPHDIVSLIVDHLDRFHKGPVPAVEFFQGIRLEGNAPQSVAAASHISGKTGAPGPEHAEIRDIAQRKLFFKSFQVIEYTFFAIDKIIHDISALRRTDGDIRLISERQIN